MYPLAYVVLKCACSNALTVRCEGPMRPERYFVPIKCWACGETEVVQLPVTLYVIVVGGEPLYS